MRCLVELDSGHREHNEIKQAVGLRGNVSAGPVTRRDGQHSELVRGWR